MGSDMPTLSEYLKFNLLDCTKPGRKPGMLRRMLCLFILVLPLTGPTTAATQPANGPTILVVGDSLSAEYGLQRGSGWVNLMSDRLASEKIPATVVNASISGDTTSGGRSRLEALLRQHQPAIVVIELGGNDALRGLPLDMTENNLRAMTVAAQKTGAKVLLIGMQVPPNYGKSYTEKFAGLFVTVAKTTKAALVPFLLKGVADTEAASRLFQADRIHPNEQAHPLILANVWPELRKLLP
jgi:acyl-CoA thioesterase-1